MLARHYLPPLTNTEAFTVVIAKDHKLVSYFSVVDPSYEDLGIVMLAHLIPGVIEKGPFFSADYYELENIADFALSSYEEIRVRSNRSRFDENVYTALFHEALHFLMNVMPAITGQIWTQCGKGTTAMTETLTNPSVLFLHLYPLNN